MSNYLASSVFNSLPLLLIQIIFQFFLLCYLSLSLQQFIHSTFQKSSYPCILFIPQNPITFQTLPCNAFCLHKSMIHSPCSTSSCPYQQHHIATTYTQEEKRETDTTHHITCSYTHTRHKPVIPVHAVKSAAPSTHGIP